MADTENAAAGPEPGELGPGRPRLPIRQLILDQLAQLPPLPETARLLPGRVRRDLRVNGAAYVYGARSAALVAGAGWLIAGALTLALWATAASAGADPGLPLRVTGQLWLAAHHVLLHAPDGPFGLSPLGFTLLPVLGLVTAGRRTARRMPGSALRAAVGAAAGYAVCACVIAACSSGNGLQPEYSQVLLYPAVIALACYGVGATASIRALLSRAEARWLPAAGRGILAALCVYLGAASLLAALCILVHAGDMALVQQQIGGGAVGECGLFLVDVALVPNAALWGAAVLAGPGFALGTGTNVSLLNVVRGPLPGLPLLAATPASQSPSMIWLLLFAVPAAAGALAAAVIGRRVAGWPDRFTAAAATAAGGGLTLAVAEMYAGGPVAFGPMSVVGSTAWLVGALVSAELLAASAAAFGLWYAAAPTLEWLRGQRRRAAWSPPVESALDSALDDDGVAELVGEGLVLGVPERPEVADAELEGVREAADEGAAEADELPVVLPDQPDADDLLADTLPGGTGPVDVPQADAEGVEGADEQGGDPGTGDSAADGIGVRVDGDRLDAGGVDDEADPVGDQQGDVVDEPGAEPLSPGGEGA